MSYKVIASLAAAALLCTTFLASEADARGGARGGGAHMGAARGGAYRGAAVSGGAYRGAAVRGGAVYRGGTVYRGGYRPGYGVGAAAAGVAIGAAAAAPYYYNNQCGYHPYPPCY